MTSTGTPAKPDLCARTRAAGRVLRALAAADLANARKAARVTRKIITWAAYLITALYTMIMFVRMMRAKRGMIMKSRIVWQQAKIIRDRLHVAARS